MTRAETPVAVVTGAGSGIGRACATTLTRDGFTVIGLGRREERLRAAGVHPRICDVTDPSATRETLDGVFREFGRIDALVNAAGIVRSAPIREMSEEDIDTLLTINVRGTLNAVRAALPGLTVNGGAIVNLSSTLALRPTPGTAVYAATKGAIEALSRALATELASDGVRVNVVAPSLVRSEIWLAAGMEVAAYEALLAARAQDYPLGRVGEPADVAEMVAFLTSSRASWITGAVVPVDGGSSVGVRPKS